MNVFENLSQISLILSILFYIFIFIIFFILHSKISNQSIIVDDQFYKHSIVKRNLLS